MASDFKNVQGAIDELLNVKSVVRRKKKTEQNKKKDLFIHAINNLEHTIIRTNIAFTDFGIDYSNYDDLFFAVIDVILKMSPYLPPENENEIILKDAHQLWELLCKLNPKI